MLMNSQNSFLNKDKLFMSLAIELAKKGRFFTSPNPLVGAVCVKNGKIISVGYHEKYGEFHAERKCLIKDMDFSGAKLYVNLEPCSHYGKTPPCTDIIIEKGISEVYIAHRDPNPLVGGKGIEKLQSSGIKVYEGLLEEKALLLNQAFLCNILKKRAYVTLKLALSIDGKLAVSSGDSKYITDEVSLDIVHSIRAESDAILVGGRTLLADNPKLSVRKRGVKKDIVKIILKRELNIPESLNIFKEKGIIVFVTDKNSKVPSWLSEQKNIEIFRYDFLNEEFLVDFLERIYRVYKVGKLLIEGGVKVSSLFLRNNLVDKLVIFHSSKKVLGGNYSPFSEVNFKSMDNLIHLNFSSMITLKDDFYTEGYINVYRPY